jgi:NAD(P)-dependent dehydrogenase (short-subunit alcohol dehydrogenase family)
VKNILSKGGLFMYKKSNLPFRAAGILLVLMAFLAGCKDEPSPSNEKNITAFKIGNAAGAIYGEKSEIHIVLPAGTALGTLSPEISVSSGASVSPKSGDSVDLTSPQTFTVTAENGSTKPYVVSASLAAALDYLSIRQRPFKTAYNQGEALDITGLIVDGYHSDGSRKEEAVAPAAVTGYNPAQAGQQVLTVTAGGKTVQFTVTVLPTPTLDYLYVRRDPFKRAYDQGEALDLTGLIVEGHYSDGSSKEETVAGTDVTGYNAAKTGNQDLTVTLGGKMVQFSVTVSAIAPLKLEIGFPAAGSTGLEIYGLPTGDIKLSVHELKENPEDEKPLPKSILISVGGKQNEVYSSIQWSVDGSTLSSGSSDNIITIRAADYAYTIPHTLTIIATKDGVRYSRSIQFTVQR